MSKCIDLWKYTNVLICENIQMYWFVKIYKCVDLWKYTNVLICENTQMSWFVKIYKCIDLWKCTIVLIVRLCYFQILQQIKLLLTDLCALHDVPIPEQMKAIDASLTSRVYKHTHSPRKGKEMFYLTTHSTHFIYGYMVSDIW